MTVKEIFELRDKGLTEEAYEAARAVFATDRSPYASTAMFWTAVDLIKLRIDEDRIEDAERIYKPMEQLAGTLNDDKGWMHEALERCRQLLQKRGRQAHLPNNQTPEHLQMGKWGEEFAASYLRERGYVILERDWHSDHRDIDIIARQGECIVFVEVKTRRNREFGDPLRSIDYQKRKNLCKAINHYVKSRNICSSWRFDVITIVGTIDGQMPDINHIEDFRLM